MFLDLGSEDAESTLEMDRLIIHQDAVEVEQDRSQHGVMIAESAWAPVAVDIDG